MDKYLSILYIFHISNRESFLLIRTGLVENDIDFDILAPT